VCVRGCVLCGCTELSSSLNLSLCPCSSEKLDVSGGVSCTVPVLAPGRAERDTYVLQLHLEPSGVAEPSCNRAIGQLGWKGP